MGNLIRIKKDDPAYDRAFKHGAAFALFLYAIVALGFHDGVNAAASFGGAIAMLVV
jgi:hypothetical protein